MSRPFPALSQLHDIASACPVKPRRPAAQPRNVPAARLMRFNPLDALMTRASRAVPPWEF